MQRGARGASAGNNLVFSFTSPFISSHVEEELADCLSARTTHKTLHLSIKDQRYQLLVSFMSMEEKVADREDDSSTIVYQIGCWLGPTTF